MRKFSRSSGRQAEQDGVLGGASPFGLPRGRQLHQPKRPQADHFVAANDYVVVDLYP